MSFLHLDCPSLDESHFVLSSPLFPQWTLPPNSTCYFPLAHFLVLLRPSLPPPRLAHSDFNSAPLALTWTLPPRPMLFSPPPHSLMDLLTCMLNLSPRRGFFRSARCGSPSPAGLVCPALVPPPSPPQSRPRINPGQVLPVCRLPGCVDVSSWAPSDDVFSPEA